MYLDLHGHTKGEGIFFYSCDPGPPQVSRLLMPSKADAAASHNLEKWLLVRTLPRLTCGASKFFNGAKNRFFTEGQDLAGKKEHTARVVCYNELGIDLSYTVESSFYAYPDTAWSPDGEQRRQSPPTMAPLDHAALVRAGSDLLEGIYRVTFLTQKLEAGNQVLSQVLSAGAGRAAVEAAPKGATQSLRERDRALG